VNSKLLTATAWITAAVIAVLNGWLLLGTMKGWLA